MTNTAKTTTKTTAPVEGETTVKRGPGRPRKYFTEEAIAQAKRDAVKRSQDKRKKANIETVETARATFAEVNVSRLSKADQAKLAEAMSSLAALKF